MAELSHADNIKMDDQTIDQSDCTTDDEKFFKNMQALCQELKDIIFAYTFKFPDIVFIRKDYMPPIPLVLNREIRSGFAKEYYGTVTFDCRFDTLFELDNFEYEGWKQHCLIKWLQNLSDSNKKVIKKIRVTMPSCVKDDRKCRAYNAQSVAAWPLYAVGMGHIKSVVVGFAKEGDQVGGSWLEEKI